MKNLTEIEFWDDYWANVKLPVEVDFDFSFDRCLANSIRNNLHGISGEVLEVGCAPGKWLAFMAKEYGLKSSGIEYSEAGMKATISNFQHIGLSYGNIRAGDFFTIPPDHEYDVVMSFGFIEHFSNVDEVVGRHLQWLKPGGILIIGVPNIQGFNLFAQNVMDKEISDKHNLSIMNTLSFHHIAYKFNLEVLFIDYIGSFEPSLPISKKGYDNYKQFMVKVGIWVLRRLRRIKMFDMVNNRNISSYILGIYKKR